MKNFLSYILLFVSITVFAQDKTEDKALLKQKLKAQNYVAEANTLANNDAFEEAEMEYRKALSIKPTQVAGAYNLGHQYFKKGNFEEALYRNQQAAKNATSKDQKHKAFHNIGNILMEEDKCKEATEAFKNALRNNPSDDETRYNYALAKECAENQKDDDKPQEDDEEGDNNKDKDENKDQDQKENNEKEQEDKGEEDKKEGDQDKDKDGEPKDEKEKDAKEGDQKDQQKQPQPGQMSPQQIKNLLEAMENQEQKVQEKINAQKVKGAKQQTEKDW
ncbi:aerotolerance regulator BatC [Olleya sp. R77988]|uniref:aerotolerance regulator BatC n=1 Tax=Olleya sp. R77988 TaxID=3093875 RepID=UPI0037CC11C5